MLVKVRKPIEDTFEELKDKYAAKLDPYDPNKFKALCPVHDDTDPSLGVTLKEHRDTQQMVIVMHCFGCGASTEAICKAWGLELSDLFENDLSAEAKPQHRPDKLGQGSLIGDEAESASYDYFDEDGKLLYTVERNKPGSSDKFVTDYPNGKTDKRVLYRLRELMAAPIDKPILVLEGEKDCDTAANMGFIATTNPFGTGAWKEEYNQYLKDRHVIVIADNDKTGRRHAYQIQAELYGVAASVKVIEALPGVKEKGDLTDWVESGGTAEGLRRIIGQEIKPKGEPYAVTLEDYLATEFKKEYLVDGLIPKANLVVLSAKSFVGKTLYAYNMATALSRGAKFLNRETTKAKTLLIQLEDSDGDVREYLSAMPREQGVYFRPQRDFALCPELAAFIRENEIDLVIIDPLANALPAGTDENDQGAMKDFLYTLRQVVFDTGATILLVHHHNKGDSMRGSTAIDAAVDVHIKLTKPEGARTATQKVRARGAANKTNKIRLNEDDLTWYALDGEQDTDKADKPKKPTIPQRVKTARQSCGDDLEEITRCVFPESVGDPEKFKARKRQVSKELSLIKNSNKKGNKK